MKIICDVCGAENKSQDFQCACGNINDEMFTTITSKPIVKETIKEVVKEEVVTKEEVVEKKKEISKAKKHKNQSFIKKGFFK